MVQKLDEELLGKMRPLLNKFNPAGAYDENLNNYDEYDLEIKSVVENYSSSMSLDDFQSMIYKVFAYKFTPEVVGDKNQFTELASSLFNLLKD